MPRTHLLIATLLLIAAGGATANATAQNDDDLRDVVTLHNGREVRGRVRTPFAADELLIMQGGSRERVDRDDVAGIDLVRSRIATFNERYAGVAGDPRRLWMLAEWALSVDLPALARLTAWQVLRAEPDHAAAHELLGHREHPRRGWMMRADSGWQTVADLDQRHGKWGRAFELAGENFVVRTDAGLEAALTALLDLERLYVWLFAEYGEPLQLVESLEPMELHVHASAGDFPAWGSDPIPYYVPQGFGDHGATWVEGAGPRPHQLFAVGTQMVLQRCLAQDPLMRGQMQRLLPTGELGFARYVESRFSGPAGRATVGVPAIPLIEADLARNAREYGVENLLHLDLRNHFYGTLGDREDFDLPPNHHWASAHMFVQFLLDESVDKQRPARFLDWLRVALAEGKGDSSSAFDAAFGLDVEELEAPFDRWLAAQGAPQRRRR